LADTYRAGLIVNRLSRDVISSTMVRSAEDEADLLGMDLIIKSGYSPMVYKTVLNRLESSQVFTKEQLKQKTDELQSFVSIASDASKYANQSDWKTIAYLAANEGATRLLDVFSERHSSPEDRKKDLAEYIKREYRRERNRKLSEDKFNKLMKNGTNEAIMQNYWFASEAIIALDKGEIELAEKFAKKSVSGITSGHVYPRLAFYRVRREQGDMSKAAQNLSLIKRWDTASMQTFNLASEAYRHIGKPKQSESILKLGEKTIGIKEPFYPEYIRLYKETNQEQLVASTLSECTTSKVQNIVAQCYHAAGVEAEDIPDSQNSVVGFIDSMTSIVDVQ
jgi:predicted Zn-dependent protease